MKIKLKDLYCNLVYTLHGKKTMSLSFDKTYRLIHMKPCIFIQCKVKDTPHYLYITGQDKEAYDKYMKNSEVYAGYGIEHSQEIFDELIKNFKYENEPKIVCRFEKNVYGIIDGLHRASLFLAKFGEDYEVDVIVKK